MVITKLEMSELSIGMPAKPQCKQLAEQFMKRYLEILTLFMLYLTSTLNSNKLCK